MLHATDIYCEVFIWVTGRTEPDLSWFIKVIARTVLWFASDPPGTTTFFHAVSNSISQNIQCKTVRDTDNVIE
jgi:hypothetical protein